MTDRHVNTIAAAALIVSVVTLAGCHAAPRNEVAIHDYYDYQFSRATEALRLDAAENNVYLGEDRPELFVPQKTRVFEALHRPTGWIVVGPRALRPAPWWRAFLRSWAAQRCRSLPRSLLLR